MLSGLALAQWHTASALAIVDDSDSSCTQPLVRREWRSLSHPERAHWLKAVRVRLKTSVIEPRTLRAQRMSVVFSC